MLYAWFQWNKISAQSTGHPAFLKSFQIRVNITYNPRCWNPSDTPKFWQCHFLVRGSPLDGWSWVGAMWSLAFVWSKAVFEKVVSYIIHHEMIFQFICCDSSFSCTNINVLQIMWVPARMKSCIWKPTSHCQLEQSPLELTHTFNIQAQLWGEIVVEHVSCVWMEQMRLHSSSQIYSAGQEMKWAQTALFLRDSQATWSSIALISA